MAAVTTAAAELYVLAADPHQLRNVAGEPQYATIVAELEKRLTDELRATGDPRVVDNGVHFETPPFTGPVNGKVKK